MFSYIHSLLLGDEWDRREREGGQKEEQGAQGQEEKGGGRKRNCRQKEGEGVDGVFFPFFNPLVFQAKLIFV